AFDLGGIAPTPEADVGTIQSELILSDLVRVETRLERIEKSISKITGDQRKALEKEQSALKKCKAALENEKPVRGVEFEAEEAKVLRAFQLMTLKPLIIVLNVGENEIDQCAAREEKIRARDLAVKSAAVACCAKSEMEIAGIEDEAERKEFLASFGIAQPAASRVIQVSYETLGLMSFFTAGPTEAHAWTIRRGQSALDAAGTIHTDLARGFIRAEVIGCEDLLRCGGMAQAKKEGLLRLEGKTYIMRDGDVIEVRFSV
ncbi:redox-regulated ATPase YchF, partial [Candidatus Sumerlaeota bacterium]|nr:redox-regulated ATPase YchF [Candidatus Sumerlaeota bacterium]